jgi:hypothetical protein
MMKDSLAWRLNTTLDGTRASGCGDAAGNP